MTYLANPNRYTQMQYRRCGKSGLKLPAISLGLWHNFGDQAPFSNSREMLLGAFDCGITHFDLANNYGPAAGSAEETFGQVISGDLRAHRDELVISTKAGYYMWPGPYGEWGSKKQLISSLDQSLHRMKLDYVDIFYHHRPDPETPLEETAEALEQIVRSGKALYIGISNYNPAQTEQMIKELSSRGIRCLIHQMRYSMFARENEAVLDVLDGAGIGSIAFSPLAQGLLTDKYLQGIPADSRAAGSSVFLTREGITEDKVQKAALLNELARERGQSLAQLALAWVLLRTTSVIIGASRLSQIRENVKTLDRMDFTGEELDRISLILKGRYEAGWISSLDESEGGIYEKKGKRNEPK